jgi:hypothetical protein
VHREVVLLLVLVEVLQVPASQGHQWQGREVEGQSVFNLPLSGIRLLVVAVVLPPVVLVGVQLQLQILVVVLVQVLATVVRVVQVWSSSLIHKIFQ